MKLRVLSSGRLRAAFAWIAVMTATSPIFGANPVESVEGQYTYYASTRDSRDDAKRIALLGARNAALANKFGTIVQTTELSTINNDGTRENEKFLALSSAESKGEWLADDGEPEFSFSLDPNDGTLIVSCRVKGSARAISNESVDFSATVLRNDPASRHSDTTFHDGDQMYLKVLSPVNGYVAVFLADESGNVFQMLPYPGSHIDEVKINRNREYSFFDPSAGTDYGQVQEMIMTAPEGTEYNQMYVLLSPERFSLPAMSWNGDRVPPSLSQENFARWLVKSRKADTRMGVQQINLVIKN